MGTLSHSAAVPALPGAQKMRSASGDWAKEWTRACSRPPPPTTSTRMRPPADVALVPGGAYAARPDAASLLGHGRPGKGYPSPSIDFWYTRNAAVASQPQTNVNTASQPSRVSTTDQSGPAASASRPAPTAHSTGL